MQVSRQARFDALVDFVFAGGYLPANRASFNRLSAGALSADSSVVGRRIGLPAQCHADIGRTPSSMTVTFTNLALDPNGIHVSLSGSVPVRAVVQPGPNHQRRHHPNGSGQ